VQLFKEELIEFLEATCVDNHLHLVTGKLAFRIERLITVNNVLHFILFYFSNSTSTSIILI
jgi:hypothetical protein